jgi:hypothetical protein
MLFLMGMAVVAGLLGSVTDWFFMGRLFHDAYNRYPEVWRPGIAQGNEKNAIFLSVGIGFLMSFAVVGLCALAGVTGITGGLALALLAWVAGPLAITAINGLFMKLDPRVILSHSVGYLLRFLLAGVAAGLALHLQPWIKR